jgi:hypothetical protein
MILRYCGRFLRAAFLTKAAYADDGDNPGSTNAPGGNGGGEGATLTQADVDRIVGERLSRAEAGFEKKHDLASLTADAAELAGIKAKREEDTEARRISELTKSGDFDKLRADYDSRLAAKDVALKTVVSLTEDKLRSAFGAIAMARVAGQLHEEAKPAFAKMITDRLGVKLDVEDGRVSVFPLGDSGHPAYNASGDPLTIDETVDALLKTNAFMRKPSGGGSGSTPTPGGDPSTPVSEAYKLAEATPRREQLSELLGEIVSGNAAPTV